MIDFTSLVRRVTILFLLVSNHSAFIHESVAYDDNERHGSYVSEGISNLVEQLGDDSVTIREKATKELTNLTERYKIAWIKVVEATQSGDPEVRMRANMILAVVELKKKVKFSDALIRWYPSIYQDLTTGDVERKYDVFIKIVVQPPQYEKHEHDFDENDLSQVISLLAVNGYIGLDQLQKATLLTICKGGSIKDDGDDGISITYADHPLLSTIPYLITLLSDEDANIRLAVAKIVGKSKAIKYACNLAPLLKDASHDVREAVSHALGEMMALYVVFSLLDNNDADFREGAICALDTIIATNTLPRSLQIIDHEVRKDPTIGEMREALCVNGLKSFLSANSQHARAWACILLVELGCTDTVPHKMIDDIKSVLSWGGTYSNRAEMAINILDQATGCHE